MEHLLLLVLIIVSVLVSMAIFDILFRAYEWMDGHMWGVLITGLILTRIQCLFKGHRWHALYNTPFHVFPSWQRYCSNCGKKVDC